MYSFIDARNSVISFLYKYFLKPIFFAIDPEVVHDRMIGLGRILGGVSFFRLITKFLFFYSNKLLEQRILGLSFRNPIGLAGGFDKNAELVDILPSVGFGFMEIGSVTGNPCLGNPKPRLWRLKKSKGLIVWYGLKSDGCEEIKKRVGSRKFKIPLGVNVAMTNCKENMDIENAISDYEKSFRILSQVGDYFTVNVSCPNTVGGQPFNEAINMDKLLKILDKIQTKKPVFVKISADTSKSEMDKIIEVAERHRVHGFIISNLTKNRDNKNIIDKNISDKGGISGKPVENLANELIAYTYKKIGNAMIVIGCGGVFTAEDAYKKIRLGASLVQLVTGMIFNGPQVISEINSGLAKLLKRDGFQNISKVVGIDNI